MNNFSMNTWAVPCDQVVECSSHKDETGCILSNWYLVSSLTFSLLVITISLYHFLKYALKKYPKVLQHLMIVTGN